MANFYVGQMVKINCPSSLVHGDETRIRRIGARGYDVTGYTYIGCEVEIQNFVKRDGSFAVFEHHELIPVKPEGYKAISWAECKEWQPEHMREATT